MTRIAARETVVQIVYALDFSPEDSEIVRERLSPEFYERMAGEGDLYDSPPGEEEGSYISELVAGVSEHLAELDGYIERYAVGWQFARIPRVAVAIMRVCMYETLYRPDVPNAAAINAAVDLCKKYEEADVAAFVNGILGSFSRAELV
ncbi:MAG: transcription antitermination factor NusB [Oscillospiraceae bacterium]|jgi:N utilization substance protein B|nr:transcription antitermination factor NusB [Oscillospiraceae bacterium]